MVEARASINLCAGELVRSLISLGVAGIIRNDPIARSGKDPEGIHQLRVCARRLRSELKVVSPALKPARTRRLSRELRWLGESLSERRDLDVMLEVLAAHLDDERKPKLLLERIEKRRDVEMRVSREVLDTKRYRDLVSQLAFTAIDPPFRIKEDEPALDFLSPGLETALNSLFDLVGDFGGSPTMEQLHLIRIKAKRARYSAVVAAQALGANVAKIASELEEVQRVLGDLHDRVIAIGYVSANTDEAEVVACALLRDSLQEKVEWLSGQWRSPLDRARVHAAEVLKQRLERS